MVSLACPAPDLSAVLDGTDDRLAKLAVRRMKIKADRDDALQVARIGLLVAARSYNAAGGASWAHYAIIVICRRLADWMRQESRAGFRGLAADERPRLEASFGCPLSRLHEPEPAESDPLAEAAWAACRRLDARSRLLIRLRFVESWTYREIGDTLGLSPERVRQIINAALLKLRRAMTADNLAN